MKIRSKILIITIGLFMFGQLSFANKGQLSFNKGQEIIYYTDTKVPLVVQTALEVFEGDLSTVLDASLHKGNKNKAQLYIHTLNTNEKADALAGRHEAFRIEVKDDKLHIVGSDANGTAYGIMELSRLLGVSPWVWWADSHPQKLEKWEIPQDLYTEQAPAVAYRGIFINDEDWGFCPWSWQTHEPSEQKGRIGPKTHERVFELLLRLRANTFWPAMHECSVPFFLTEGNQEIADRYGITIGTSHCEPMQRNTNGEWKLAGVGEYDYVKNPGNVYKFWEERVKEVAQSNNYFTLGMRGVHDGKMQGANTIEEQRNVLDSVFKDQRKLIEQYVNKDVTKVPQVFIPYKEVLDIYRSGLSVPDDVTLMWCDDNFGYIKYLPNEKEQKRKGGNGIYYHISYWGNPHDYLWLATTSPALIQTELERAYDHNARQLWIINVGDIKPGEYLLEYCLDMAWDKNVLYNRNTNDHLKKWLSREFGEEITEKLIPLWNEYYALSYRCRPEFLGNTRVEKSKPEYRIVKDLPWRDSDVKSRLDLCIRMEKEITQLSYGIDKSKQSQWYQLVEYPIRSFCAMNRKMLGGQLARHAAAPWSNATEAYNDIVSMTETYNSLSNGKWNHMMSYNPRNLPVFAPLDTTTTNTPLEELSGQEWRIKPSNGTFNSNSYIVKELGYSREALVLRKGDVFSTSLPSTSDSLSITLTFVPNHPVDTEMLQIKVDVDGEKTQFLNYETRTNSEEWKMNVLYNQARRKIKLPASSQKRMISIQALTPGIILDEIIINDK